MELVIADSVLSWNGEIISSSQIRAGLMDRKGNSWIPRKISSSDARLTSLVEAELKTPFGLLIEGPEEDTSIAINEALSIISKSSDFNGLLIAVGDVTVLGFQKAGRTADLAFIDGQTKRSHWPSSGEIDRDMYDNIIQCTSPAGSLTNSLLEACSKSLSSWVENEHSSLIVVTGEEDLIIDTAEEIYQYGQLFTATDTIIENVIGSFYNDIIKGNDADNKHYQHSLDQTPAEKCKHAGFYFKEGTGHA